MTAMTAVTRKQSGNSNVEIPPPSSELLEVAQLFAKPHQGFRNCAQQFVQPSNSIVKRKRLLLMPNTGTIARKASSHSPN